MSYDYFFIKKKKNFSVAYYSHDEALLQRPEGDKKKKITKIMKFVAIIAIDFTFYHSTFIGSLN